MEALSDNPCQAIPCYKRSIHIQGRCSFSLFQYFTEPIVCFKFLYVINTVTTFKIQQYKRKHKLAVSPAKAVIPVVFFSVSILDAAGKQIGIWYSVWDTTIVKMEKDNQVVVHTPNLPLQKIKFLDSSD
jgi:hypothetical protein